MKGCFKKIYLILWRKFETRNIEIRNKLEILRIENQLMADKSEILNLVNNKYIQYQIAKSLIFY